MRREVERGRVDSLDIDHTDRHLEDECGDEEGECGQLDVRGGEGSHEYEFVDVEKRFGVRITDQRPVHQDDEIETEQDAVEGQLAVQGCGKVSVRVLGGYSSREGDIRGLHDTAAHHNIIKSFLLDRVTQGQTLIRASRDDEMCREILEGEGCLGVLVIHILREDQRLLFLAQLLLRVTKAKEKDGNRLSVAAQRFGAVLVISHGIENVLRHDSALFGTERRKNKR